MNVPQHGEARHAVFARHESFEDEELNIDRRRQRENPDEK
jgi:hypothetical protein